jgi:citrate lyase subunit beta/citryl-CoA lyase
VSPAAATAALRSWLFVPGDSERKQARALATPADALILDLEDSVDASQRPAARARVAALLAAPAAARTAQLWVRVNAPASGLLREDLAGVCAQALPAGIVLPKVNGPQEILQTADQLDALEAQRHRPRGAIRVLVLATETARGLLALPGYPAALSRSPSTLARLSGLTWGAEDLSAALGALGKRAADGSLTFTYQLARSTCLLAAAALQVAAIDTVYTEFRDAAGLARELDEARRDGFSGKLAIHPDQISAINAAFTPTAAERRHAERVVAAFAAAGNAGVASLDGQMIDRPHLLQAQRVLARSQDP